MTDTDDTDTRHDGDEGFDAALRAALQHGDDPADAGFSLRVMAALPAPSAPRRQRWARWLRHAHWLAISLAACSAAALLGQPDPLDLPHALAAAALTALLIFWSVPNRWHRG